jgi:class 3 adenylate cyclase/pimeloyl-ACP methyl ester carboxylesterase
VQPETHYARSGDISIAYQVVGDGRPDFVFVPAISHLELVWDCPSEARFLTRVASNARLIMLNQRGTGMSDHVAGVPTLEARMDDIRAVMEAADSERAVVFGLGDAGPLAVLFAATYPERTLGLVLMNSAPRFVRNTELPWLPTRAETETQAEEYERRWGERSFAEDFMRASNPSIPEDELGSYARLLRLSVSPGSAAAYVRMNAEVEVSHVLPSIRLPTLVLHRTHGPWDIRSGRYLAEHIAGARLVELPGADFGPYFGDQEQLFLELEGFLGEVSEGNASTFEPDRVLATVLFTDVVDATARAVELGDRAWRELLAKHHETVRRLLGRYRGVEQDTAGDGFFASFDGPARAIRCASAIVESMADLKLAVRAGLHTGECELLDGKVAGIAVHTGARVSSLAQPGEVLVSSTVKDLVAGSGITFEDRGAHELKGIPGEWRVYAVTRAN